MVVSNHSKALHAMAKSIGVLSKQSQHNDARTAYGFLYKNVLNSTEPQVDI